MPDPLKDVADIIAPELGVSELVGKIVAGLVVLAVLGFVIWKVFFAEHAAQQKHDLAAAHAQAGVGQAQGNAGAAAANIVAGGATRETIIHETTRDHYVDITRQPGASDPVSDAVDAAGRRAVCVRASAAGLPDCQRLQKADP